MGCARSTGGGDHPVSRARRALVAAGFVAAGLAALEWNCPLRQPRVAARLVTDWSTAHLGPGGDVLRLDLSPSGRYRLHLPLGAIAPEVVSGFVISEDHWFRWHPGINPVSLVRAGWQDLRAGRIVSGGSTIAMQVARMLNPGPRTFAQKLAEAWCALHLRAHYSSTRLLELYLNTVPMGGNLEGVGAAAYFYFGKPASLLSWGEAAQLVALPRSPERLRPDRHPDAALRARGRVLEALVLRERLTREERDLAGTAPVPAGRRANPLCMPHLVRRGAGLGVPGRILSYLIRPDLQAACERRLKASSVRLQRIGVREGALIVVDNRTMAVLAYVGSPDFAEPRTGQVNGCAIHRSPGSALKPFLYAAGVERGTITPHRMVLDVPHAWNGFAPVNFEPGFCGPVPAEQALVQSLNVPAVALDADLGDAGLHAVLERAGLRDAGRARLDAGLSAVLGAFPVTVEEMASLYAMLANGGRRRPLRFTAGDPASDGVPVLSPAACFVVSEMLATNARPDLPLAWEWSPHHGKIAFKTGTSFGFRDAWAVGYTPRYTVAVWFGNADARGAAGLKAREIAAPVLFDILNPLAREGDEWFAPPAGVARRTVCAVTGEPAGRWCRRRGEDWYVAGVSDMTPCGVHQQLRIRKADGVEVCSDCMDGPEEAYGERVVAIWPPDVEQFFRATGRRFDELPRHDPACRAPARRAGPTIASPGPAEYLVASALPADRQRIALHARTGSDTERLWWFVGDALVASAPPADTCWWTPRPGRWDVVVLDARGRSDRVRINIRPGRAESLAGPGPRQREK